MKDDVLMEYVRDRKGHKVGMLIGTMGPNDKVEIGWSRCHKEDTFTRLEGLEFAAENVGTPIPHSFAKAAKAFRVSCFLRFNAPVVIPRVMTHGLQKRQSKPATGKNSGHRKGCGAPTGESSCICYQLALQSRISKEDKIKENIDPSDEPLIDLEKVFCQRSDYQVQTLGRCSRG